MVLDLFRTNWRGDSNWIETSFIPYPHMGFFFTPHVYHDCCEQSNLYISISRKFLEGITVKDTCNRTIATFEFNIHLRIWCVIHFRAIYFWFKWMCLIYFRLFACKISTKISLYFLWIFIWVFCVLNSLVNQFVVYFRTI